MKNYMPILMTILIRLVRNFNSSQDFSVKFVRLCNLMSGKYKKTFDRGVSGVLVECLGIRDLEEACCYLLACMDENQIPMIKTQLPVHLQQHFNKALQQYNDHYKMF